jgi:hypothetical protein
MAVVPRSARRHVVSVLWGMSAAVRCATPRDKVVVNAPLRRLPREAEGRNPLPMSEETAARKALTCLVVLVSLAVGVPTASAHQARSFDACIGLRPPQGRCLDRADYLAVTIPPSALKSNRPIRSDVRRSGGEPRMRRGPSSRPSPSAKTDTWSTPGRPSPEMPVDTPTVFGSQSSVTDRATLCGCMFTNRTIDRERWPQAE